MSGELIIFETQRLLNSSLREAPVGKSLSSKKRPATEKSAKKVSKKRKTNPKPRPRKEQSITVKPETDNESNDSTEQPTEEPGQIASPAESRDQSDSDESYDNGF